VVVSVHELDCFDLIIWLRTGEEAAKRIGYSQSKVSRTIAAVSRTLDISIEKRCNEWHVLGDLTILNLERRVHQQYRWNKGSALRLEAQYYSGPLFCDPIPNGWVAGNFDYLEIHTPLRHLRDSVIDAWIGCFPGIPEPNDKDLICFHLTRLPTHLVVAENHPLVAKGDAISMEDVQAYPSLALPDGAFPKVQEALQRHGLWNLTVDRLRYSKMEWEGRVETDLAIGYATAFSICLFEKPQVILPISIPLTVGDSIVVRRQFANHPNFLSLLTQLRQKAQMLAQEYPDVSIPES